MSVLKAVCALLILLLSTTHSTIAQPAQVQQKAQRYFFSDEYEAAVALLKAAPTLSPKAHYLLGHAYQGLLEHQRAVDTFAQADTLSVRLLAAWGQSLRRLGRSAAARNRYKQAYRRDSTNQSVALALAELYAGADQWSRAKTVVARLLEEHPDNPFLLAHLATAYHALDSTSAAAHYYRRAYRQNPQSTQLPLRLSALYLAADSLTDARRVIAEALEHHPQHPALWARRGQIALAGDRYKQAARGFRKAVALGDSSAANLRKLGIALFMIDRPKQAAPPLRAAYAADSTHAQTTFYLGLVEKQLGRLDEALHHLKRATRLFGQHTLAEVYAQLSDLHGQRKAYVKAIRADRLALRLNPEKIAVVFHLATLYDTYYADPSTALAHYRRFLQRVGAGAFPEMQAYARWRISMLAKEQFFTPRAAHPDSAGPSPY